MLNMIVDVEAVLGFPLIYRSFPDCKQACICFLLQSTVCWQVTKFIDRLFHGAFFNPHVFRSPQHGITTKNIQAWETRLPALKWSWNKMILNNAKMQCILAFVTLAYTSCNFMILQNITRRKRLSDRLAMSFLAPLRVHGVSTVEHVDKRGWVEKSGVDKGLAILWGSKSLPLSSAPKPWREAWVYIISIKIYQVRNPWISTLKLRLCPRRVEGLLPGKGHVEDTQCSSCLFGDGIWKITWYT